MYAFAIGNIKILYNSKLKSFNQINWERIVCGVSAGLICIWRLACTHIWFLVRLQYCHHRYRQNDLLLDVVDWHNFGRWLVGCSNCYSNHCSSWHNSHLEQCNVCYELGNRYGRLRCHCSKIDFDLNRKWKHLALKFQL